jgi:indole-3-glycerol phosphate synthase
MILERILATKHQEVKRLLESTSNAHMEKQISNMYPCRGFVSTLIESPNRSIGLIAEVKKASPSKGVIRNDFEPVPLAAAYERAGADCLSVLTDEQYFQGSNDFLQAISKTIKLPILRKDFIVSESQILQARCIGADAVLLIAAALTTKQMRDFHRLAQDVGLDVLVEVHDREELERALEVELHLLGINNRNLHTFATDLHTTEQLLAHIPKNIPVVSESGIASASDVEYLRTIGARALLIGETFMRQADVEAGVHSLMGPL